MKIRNPNFEFQKNIKIQISKFETFLGSSWKSVGKLMSLKQYNMASGKGEKAFQGARKSV